MYLPHRLRFGPPLCSRPGSHILKIPGTNHKKSRKVQTKFLHLISLPGQLWQKREESFWQLLLL